MNVNESGRGSGKESWREGGHRGSGSGNGREGGWSGKEQENESGGKLHLGRLGMADQFL